MGFYDDIAALGIDLSNPAEAARVQLPEGEPIDGDDEDAYDAAGGPYALTRDDEPDYDAPCIHEDGYGNCRRRDCLCEFGD